MAAGRTAAADVPSGLWPRWALAAGVLLLLGSSVAGGGCHSSCVRGATRGGAPAAVPPAPLGRGSADTVAGGFGTDGTVEADRAMGRLTREAFESSGRLIPGFMLVGEAKSGTTSLFRLFADSPNFAPPATKEVCGRTLFTYFDRQEPPNGQRTLERWAAEYAAAFPKAKAANVRAVTGDGCTYYLSDSASPRRVAEAFPGIKVLVVVREPAARFFSNFNHKPGPEWSGSKNERAAMFGEAARREVAAYEAGACEITERGGPYRGDALNCLTLRRGLYAQNIRRWVEAFGRDRVHVVLSNDVVGSAEARKEVLEFAGLEPGPLTRRGLPKVNSRSTKMPWVISLHAPNVSCVMAELSRFYQPHTEELFFEILQRPIPDSWRQGAREHVAACVKEGKHGWRRGQRARSSTVPPSARTPRLAPAPGLAAVARRRPPTRRRRPIYQGWHP